MLGSPDSSTLSDENSDLAGACTLLMALETEKDSGRMIIDAKIETLYEGSGDMVLDIRMLATLLGYVQKYCMGRDIKHLSIMTMAEHPTWLTNFFTLAGFKLCECLKTDDLESGQRICLKLGKSLQQPTEVVQNANKPDTNGIKEKHPAASKPAIKPPSLTIKGTAPGKALDEDEAAKWLSQNQQILSPASASAHAAPPKSDMVQTPSKTTNESPKISVSVTGGLPHPGEKRKRSDTFSRDHGTDNVDRNVRRREEDSAREPTKQEMREVQERLSLSLQKQREALQRATDKVSDRGAGSIPPSSKPNVPTEERPRKTGDMTDALLAQYSKHSPVNSSINIKKEATKQASSPNPHLTPAVRGGSPDASFWRSNGPFPAKSLTCFYWASQGYCLKDERDCLHAHHHTGEVARPPPSYKYKAYKNGFLGSHMSSDAAEDEYDPHQSGHGYKGKHGRPPGDASHGKDQGMSIRGSENGSKNVKEEKGAPTQPKIYQDMNIRPGDNPYDSYRPRH